MSTACIFLNADNHAETIRNACEDARRKGSQIHDRQTLAVYWLAKLQWLTDRLEPNESATVVEIVYACQSHYEHYA